MVVSLGVDTFKDDPISQFQLESEHFLEVGTVEIAGPSACRRCSSWRGGYAVDALGVNAVRCTVGLRADCEGTRKRR